jgi:uncharacterized protein (TIGR02466 family)
MPRIFMQVTTSHLDLFPTRLWTFDLSGLQAHFSAWQTELDAMRQNSPTAAGRSNRHGWNSDKTVFAQPSFAPLRKACEGSFAHAFREMGAPGSLRYRLEAWANIHDPGAYNTVHLHQNVLLSGSFYLAVPEGAGALVFRDPRPGAVLSPFRGKGANACQTINIRPKAGALVVFPNWLEHAVETHEGTTPRICIAMNALPG